MILPIYGPPFSLLLHKYVNILLSQEYLDAIYLSFRGWDLRIWIKHYHCWGYYTM